MSLYEDISNLTNSSEYYYVDYAVSTNERPIAHVYRDWFVLLYTPILVVFGLSGNLLTFVVFLKSKLNKITSSFYLASLAISDSLILFDLSLEWLESFNVGFYGRNYFCQVLTFINVTAHFLSLWLIVAFCVERFLVESCSRRQTRQKSKQSKAIAIGIFIFASVTKIPFLIFYSSQYSEADQKHVCQVDQNVRDGMRMFAFADRVVGCVIPSFTIVFLNSIVAYKLGRQRKLFQKRHNNSQSSRSSSKDQSSLLFSSSHINRLNASPNVLPMGKLNIGDIFRVDITQMLLKSSTVFIGLTLPNCIMRLSLYENVPNVIQFICGVSFVTNFAIKFFIYYCCGYNFRKAVHKILSSFTATFREKKKFSRKDLDYQFELEPLPSIN